MPLETPLQLEWFAALMQRKQGEAKYVCKQLKTIMLLTGLAVLFVIIGGAIGGKNGATIALASPSL